MRRRPFPVQQSLLLIVRGSYGQGGGKHFFVGVEHVLGPRGNGVFPWGTGYTAHEEAPAGDGAQRVNEAISIVEEGAGPVSGGQGQNMTGYLPFVHFPQKAQAPALQGAVKE